MKTRYWLLALAAMLAPHTHVQGLTTPSVSDGPVKLLTCIVTPQGVLEAEVDSQADEAMNCNIRCNYELGDRRFSHMFTVTIPARFHGRVGGFNTSTAKAGNYSGDLGDCKSSRQ